MKKRVGLLTLDIRKAEEAAVEEMGAAVKVGTDLTPGGVAAGFELTKIESSIYLSSNSTQRFITI
jgi:hypothetical protein